MMRLTRTKGFAFFLTLAAQLFGLSCEQSAVAAPIPSKTKSAKAVSKKIPLAQQETAYLKSLEDEDILLSSLTPSAQEKTKQLNTVLSHSVFFSPETGAPKSPTDSSGWCARSVVNAVNQAGIKLQSANAKDMPPNLVRAGFVKLFIKGDYKPLPGDVAIIMPPSPENPNGHAAIYCADGYWYSDYKQTKGKDGAWCYGGNPRRELISYYRHPAFSDSQKVAELKLAKIEVSPSYSAYMEPVYLADPLKRPGPTIALAQASGLMASQPVVQINVPSLKTSISQKDFGPKTDKQYNPKPVVAQIAYEKKEQPPETLIRHREDNHVDIVPSDAALLQEQWRLARKEVLKRNSASKNGECSKVASKQLRANVRNMYALLDSSMQENAAETFKAARYVLNKCDDKTLFNTRDVAEKRQKILELISQNIDEITKQDAKLGLQAAKYVFTKAGKGELRESVRPYLAKKPQKFDLTA